MNKTHEDIKVIRDMMEKSSKFLSFSGLSGIIAGIIAVAGAAFAYFYLLRDPSLTDFNHKQEIGILLADALAVLILSIGVCLWLSYRKAHKRHQKLWNSAAR
ncbi:MAG: hypothetical protein FWG22_03670, partial [Prolixibacteraceae bacterium]|nr:hypothetical protein [Prolixibacteraceae bacterium]